MNKPSFYVIILGRRAEWKWGEGGESNMEK
jgi:hypothetical protein